MLSGIKTAESFVPLKTSVPKVGGVVPKQVMEVSEEQERKALSPMLVTLLGIVMEIREEQAEKV